MTDAKSDKKLFTLAEWQKLSPRAQGYVLYMESEWPGSELKGHTCPYAIGSADHAEFSEGERRAVQAAMDSEE
jgi:hypothetical protein